jgi:hypothetical protein
MATFLSVLIASITLCLVADDDKPAPAKKVVVEKTSPKDWPKNAKNVPIPPKDWITVERFDAPKKLAYIRLKGEEKTRTVKVGSGVARDVKVSVINPFGKVAVKLKDGTRIDYYQAGREKAVKEQEAIRGEAAARALRQAERIKRRNGL